MDDLLIENEFADLDIEQVLEPFLDEDDFKFVEYDDSSQY